MGMSEREIMDAAWGLVGQRMQEAVGERSHEKLVNTCLEVIFAHVESSPTIAAGIVSAQAIGSEHNYMQVIEDGSGGRSVVVVNGRDAVGILSSALESAAVEFKQANKDRISEWKQEEEDD